MNEQIQKLQDEILIAMTVKNDRGAKLWDVDVRHKRDTFAKQVELQKLRDAEDAKVKISPEDQASNAAYAAYQERQQAARALLNPNQMPLAQTLKAQATVRGETAPVAAKPAAQPVGRGGPIFSKA